MYARSTTMRGSAQAMDDTIAYVRGEVMSTLMTMPGCIGLSMLADRESGRCIITSSWDSEEAMRASAEGVRGMRDRATQLMGGAAEVDEWEVAVMHRMHETHDGTCARVIWGRTDAEGLRDHLDDFRMAVLPKLEALPGFCSVSMMIDRLNGRMAAATAYDSREAMMQNSDHARAIREEFARSADIEVTAVDQFDLVLAHLRVPETV